MQIYHRKGRNKGYFRFTCLNYDCHFKDVSLMKAVFDSVPTEFLAVLKKFERKRAGHKVNLISRKMG